VHVLLLEGEWVALKEPLAGVHAVATLGASMVRDETAVLVMQP
jgi:hypothetical protein